MNSAIIEAKRVMGTHQGCPDWSEDYWPTPDRKVFFCLCCGKQFPRRFVSVMQHQMTLEQAEEARLLGEVTELADKSLLIVPDDPELGRDFFLQRAEEIIQAVGGLGFGDVFHAGGQAQLVAALVRKARDRQAFPVESVTARESVDQKQEDGSVKKTAVFRFRGFRPVYQF